MNGTMQFQQFIRNQFRAHSAHSRRCWLVERGVSCGWARVRIPAAVLYRCCGPFLSMSLPTGNSAPMPSQPKAVGECDEQLDGTQYHTGSPGWSGSGGTRRVMGITVKASPESPRTPSPWSMRRRSYTSPRALDQSGARPIPQARKTSLGLTRDSGSLRSQDNSPRVGTPPSVNNCRKSSLGAMHTDGSSFAEPSEYATSMLVRNASVVDILRSSKDFVEFMEFAVKTHNSDLVCFWLLLDALGRCDAPVRRLV